MKFKNYLSLLFLFIAAVINAQIIEIKGKVIDSKNKASIPGVNIVVKSSKKGVTTDLDGNFLIKVNSNDVLVFSNIGYASKEIKVSKSQTLNVELQEEANKLEEVVINVGYGTQKKKNITNAISTIKSEAFDDRPLYDVGQALQGNAAGVNVVQPSGKPGVGLDIKIRGLSSMNSGNNPIFVIDGVQTYDSTGISTDDIVDIQVLKDATATAIYGVNGSAGVVIITTKRGKANKNVFSFSSYFGISKIVKNLDVLDPAQYKALMGQINSGYVGYINDPKYVGINTNWRDLVFQTGEDKNYDFSYSGGTNKIKAFASLGYQDTKGIVRPSSFSRLSSRINIDIDATSWLKAHANMNLIQTKLKNTSDNNSANQGGVILSTLTTPSFLPVYAQDLVGGSAAGGQLDGQFAANPVASLENPVSFQSRQEDNNTSRYLSNLGLDITLAKNLVWKPSSTVDVYRSVYDFFVDSFRSNYGRGEASAPENTKGIGREHTARNYNWNLENTLNYAIKSGNHDINLMVGSSIQKQRYDQLKIEGTGFATNIRELDLSQMMLINRQASDTIAREKNYISYFGRATYNFKGKYILNGVFRASGASQLASGHKWGYFPGVSAAWIISNEEFLRNSSSVSELKLRGGWGQSGNINGVSEYSSFGLLGDDHGTLQNYINTDLTWETTSDMNIGLDIGIISNRVRLTVDAFKKITTNLFNNITVFNIPYFYNGGKLENKGLEFSLNTINFKGDFNWNTNFNISFIKNKVLQMGKYTNIIYKGYNGVNRIEEGGSLGNFYGYVVDRVNPTTGILEYKDLNGDGKINTSDQTTIGNAMPNYTFGITNTFSYEGFSLDVLLTGSQGNDIFNASRIDLEGMKDNKNQSVAVLDRWTTVGQITDVPKAGPTNFQGISATANSTRWIEDGSYVRLKAATLGYNFKKLFLGLNTLKLYATGQNLVTWTKYLGFDPEVSAFGGSTGTGQGIDYGTYPQVRTFIFGLKAGF
jgi:TonB-linked SusC/RagA family outer membrane protein